MSFGAPYWFFGLALLPALALLFARNERRRRVLLQKIVAPRLAAQLAGSSSTGRRLLRFGLMMLGIAAVIASLAQPQYGYTWEQSKRSGRDVFIAIDTSKSMLSSDVAPNRLTRAKLAAQDLVMQLQGDRAGVLAFAGEAFLQTPLTIDYNATLDAVNDLNTDTIPVGGTDIAAVINEAARAFGKGESEDRALILFTDGEDLDGDAVAAAKAQKGNFRIFTVGVGTPEGSLIPVPGSDGGTDFVKDPDSNQIVKSKLDEGRLKEIAAATGGFYTHLQNGPEDMKRIVEEGLGKMREHDITARMTRQPIDRYQWPLGLGLVLVFASMLVSERRREWKVKVESGMTRLHRAPLIVIAMLIAAHSARAQMPKNDGLELYNDKKYKESYDSFNQQLSRNPDSQALEFDSGAAAYKTGEYEKAIDAFGRATTSAQPGVREKAEYNLGNSLFMRGTKQEAKETKIKDWKDAIQHYDEALKVDPKDGDAKYNRDLVAKLIDELNQPPPPQQQQNKKQDQKKQDQDQQNQSKQQNQQNQQNKQDQSKNQQQNSNGGNSQQNSGEKNPQNSQQAGSGQNQQNQQQQPQQNQGSQGSKPDEGKNGQQNQASKGNGSQPSPTPSQDPGETPGDSGKTPTGNDIKPAQSSQGGAQNGQREEAYAPGQQRKMTPTEAARVVDAEKDEEPKGMLNERKASAPVLRDW